MHQYLSDDALKNTGSAVIRRLAKNDDLWRRPWRTSVCSPV
ncbi:hypothetical protein [Streptomyces sp. NPDC047009]